MTKSLMNPYRKLLVLGLNTLLNNNLLSLHWDKGKKDNGHHFCILAGEPSVITWNDAGFGEVQIAVWWKYDHSKHPKANASGNHKEQFLTSSPLAKRQHYPKFVGVVVGAWLERDSGKYLQGENQKRLVDVYTRKGERQYLDEIPTPTPQGYKTEGPFHI